MDKKLPIFLVLFFAFIFAWQKFIVDPMLKKNAPQPVATTAAPQQAAPVPNKPVQTTPAAVVQPAAPIPVQAESQSRNYTVDTPLYRAEFNTQGAVLTSFRLKKYTDDFNQPLEIVPHDTEMKVWPLSLDFENKQMAEVAAHANFSIDGSKVSLDGTDSKSVEFRYSDGRFVFVKDFTFKADSYIIGASLEAMDGSAKVPVRVVWMPGIETTANYKDPTALRPSRAMVDIGEKVERFEGKKYKEFTKVGAGVRWAGVENNYFAGIFIPSQPADAYLNAAGADDKSVHNVVLTLAGTQAEALKMNLFVGPKDYSMLKNMDMDLQQVIDFGWWGPVVKVLFVALQKLHALTNNYGWAIVLLTIAIKIIFTPFMQKSFASQKKMQAMQPEMKEVQDRYAKMKNDDPRKQNMNMEVMALHKRYGVSPLGGCLPMLVQMPVLFGFYKVLSQAIELRKAPFIFWLTDLSVPDPYHITPVVMGASMFLQQRMTPVTDPMQKNMMYMMPLIFTYMSFKLQSGLVLYWLLSNLLGLLHQRFFQWQYDRAAVAVKDGNA